MQPYASHPSAAAALEAAGPGAVAALMAVLAAGDPTDWPMLPYEVDGYKVSLLLMCRCCGCYIRGYWSAVAGEMLFFLQRMVHANNGGVTCVNWGNLRECSLEAAQTAALEG
jgi:hypothetical protein